MEHPKLPPLREKDRVIVLKPGHPIKLDYYETKQEAEQRRQYWTWVDNRRIEKSKCHMHGDLFRNLSMSYSPRCTCYIEREFYEKTRKQFEQMKHDNEVAASKDRYHEQKVFMQLN